MKAILILLTALFCLQPVAAGELSEEGVPTSPVSAYSLGLGAGAFYALNDELKQESDNFLKLSFINSIYLNQNMNLFMDVDWFAPGPNYGLDLGFDFLINDRGFRPFIGMGAGAHVFDKEGMAFGKNLGTSLTAHLGFLLDLSDRTQIRVRVPYHFTANDNRDHTIGLDIGVFFSDQFRHAKKLNYR